MILPWRNGLNCMTVRFLIQVGGKLLFDYHAARVLPGSTPT